jgi:hypothetical protein
MSYLGQTDIPFELDGEDRSAFMTENADILTPYLQTPSGVGPMASNGFVLTWRDRQILTWVSPNGQLHIIDVTGTRFATHTGDTGGQKTVQDIAADTAEAAIEQVAELAGAAGEGAKRALEWGPLLVMGAIAFWIYTQLPRSHYETPS